MADPNQDTLSAEDRQALQSTLAQLKQANDPRAGKLEAFINANPAPPETGVMAGLKRNAKALINLPGTVIDAFTKPPQNDAEKAIMGNTQGTRFEGDARISLAMKRLIHDPMQQQAAQADAYQQQATGNTQVPPTALGFQAGMGNTPQEQAQHLANMHRIASYVPVLGPMAADMSDRFMGTGAYQGNPDKSGAMTDLAVAVAGPKAAEQVVKGGLGVVAKGAPGLAERLYQSGLKPSTTLTPAERATVVRTGIDAGIPITDMGVNKLQGLIDNLNDAVKGEIAKNPNAPVNKFKVASRLSDTAKTFANQVAPTRDLNSIADVGNDFLQTQPGIIGAQDAQALKTGTYQRLSSRAYGEAGSAVTEAEKSLARGLKEELETHFPEIKDMNAQTSKFYGLQEELTRAVNRARNHNLLGIGPTTAAAGGAAIGAVTGHPIAGAAPAMIMKAVLDDPAFKSKLAIAVSKAGKVPPAIAFSRVGQLSNALAQSLNAGANPAPAESQ